MTTTLILEGTTAHRHHRERLESLAKEAVNNVSIASAYVTDYSILKLCGHCERRLLTSLNEMDIAAGATSIESLRCLLENGVVVRFLPSYPRFHAKTYIFGSSIAIVTSANLTTNALASNIEVGSQVTGKEAEELLEWFNRLWEKAAELTLEQLEKIHVKIQKIRREYVKFKRKVKQSLELPFESFDAVPQTDSVTELLVTAERYFVINTNRRYDKKTLTGGFLLEERMKEMEFAAAWEKFKSPAHMAQVEQGDAIFAYAKGVGIIGIGTAKSKYETRDLDARDRLRPPDDKNKIEWRVPTKWLVWRDAAEAYRFKAQNASFWRVTGADKDNLRNRIASHFLQ